MSTAAPTPSTQPAEQLRYARWLDGGTRVGLVVLVASFVAYAAGWPAPQVPLDRLPQLWSMPVEDYLQAAGLPTGWGWVRLLNHGDVLGLAGIALLAGCSLPALLALLPLYHARRDRIYVALVLAEAAVLVLAASGLLNGGH